MKTCQNCKARSKDDVVKCVHCGNLFGERPDSENSADNNDENKDSVKQTLFGIPAQKLEELLAPQSQAEDEDLSKKTMAGFNISGLFGDQEEKSEPSPVLPPVEYEDDIPEKIELRSPQKTMAGLNVSGLFNDKEKAPETTQVPDIKEESPDKKPKFGTMLGISVADVMASGKTEEENIEPKKTLFSLPTFDASGQSEGSEENSETAIFRAAPKTSSFTEKTPSRASLGSLLPKVALQKKDKMPIIAVRADVKTPVEFAKQARELAASQESKSGASGIIRKSKSGISKSEESKKKSGVVGSYTIGKQDLTSDSVSRRELDQDAKKTEPNIVPETLINKLAVKVEKQPDTIDAAASETVIASEEEPETPSAVVISVDTPEIEKKDSKTIPSKKKKPENYTGSITTIQSVFIIAGVIIILGTIGALFSQVQRSTFDLAAMGLSVLTLLGSLFALLGSKNDVLKGSVWSLSAVLLISIGAIGFFISTPLTVFFIFAGALFLISALFPKIVSML